MMDAFCAPEVEQVTVLKSARIGYTKIIGHVTSYYIHQDPCSVLIVQPTIGDAEDYSKDEIQPTLQETPVLREIFGDSKSRNSGSTITRKKYPGGTLRMVGANAPGGFRRITVRVVLFDEVDGYPPTAGQEGDQIKLGKMRAETMWNRKYGLGSTPVDLDTSRITASFNQSDRGYFFLTCPHCGGEHIRLFRQPDEAIVLRGEKVKVSHITWVDDNPNTAAWMCPDCSTLIDYDHHRDMCDAGRWIGETWEWTHDGGFSFMPEFSRHIGFRIWAGYSYSPNSTPKHLVKEFLESKGDRDLLKTFVNTILGEAWKDAGEQANESVLLDRREKYPAEVPAGACVLSLGADVQKDRIEFEVVGWSEEQESWSVDYQILPGDPTQPYVWEDFKECLQQKYKHESGAMLPISAICVDEGYLTQIVRAFVMSLKRSYAFATKGEDGPKRGIVENDEQRRRRLRKRKTGKYRPEIIGTHQAKSLLMHRLQLPSPGPGYCHFPMERDEEYFAQLTAERRVTRYRKGYAYHEWEKVRDRNEALDCRILAHAGLLLVMPEGEKERARFWRKAKGTTVEAERKPAPNKRQQTPTGFGSDDWSNRL